MGRIRPKSRAIALAALLVSSPAVAQNRVTFEQAAPVLNALPSNLPTGLRGRSPQELARLWPSWVEQHDRDVRARLARGDEDSLVNFWLYGTSFTNHPPAIARSSLLPVPTLEILRARLEDLLNRVSAPGNDERLQFARRILAMRNADPATVDGRERARRLLLETRQRMVREFASTERALAAARSGGEAAALTVANATIFRDRGLSSDTSILSDYSVHVALETITKQGTLAPGGVRRVAIVGPGLDFTNKADGYDYYPQQTIQPFALVDTLRRLRLAAADLQVTTFDINARVNEHLRNAASRAASPSGYVVTLPLDGHEAWTGAVLDYWQQWGNAIGGEVAAVPPPAVVGTVKTRTVQVQPGVVSSITPRDLNIVVDRLPLRDDERFDLVVATNVLVYYDVFEQALAAANVAAMLRPGGVFMTNTAVLPTPPLRATAEYMRVAHTAERYDEMFWYERAR
jgi:SAM-dependent methyltransferase